MKFLIENSILIFIIISLLFAMLNAYATVFISKSKSYLKHRIISCLIISIAVIVIFFCFLMSSNTFVARLFCSLYYIGIEWLIFSLFRFVVLYTLEREMNPSVETIMTVIVCFISLIFVFNIIYPFCFDLEREVKNWTSQEGEIITQISVWSKKFTEYKLISTGHPTPHEIRVNNLINLPKTEFNLLFVIHLAYCYSISLALNVMLLIKFVKAPVIYKSKYGTLIISFILAVLLNNISARLKLFVDFSVFTYPFISFFVCFFALYSAPEKLEKRALYEISEDISDAIICFDTTPSLIYYNKKTLDVFGKEKNQKEKEIDFEKVMQFYSKTIKKVLEICDYNRRNNIKNGPSFYEVGHKEEFETPTIPGHSVKKIKKSLVNKSALGFKKLTTTKILEKLSDWKIKTSDSKADFIDGTYKLFEDNMNGHIENQAFTWVEEFRNSEGQIVKYFTIEFRQILSDNSVVGSFVKLADNTEDISKTKREYYIATHDSLTKLYNRKRFFEVASQLLQKEPYETWYMMSSNIKDFKLINELFGAKKGDELLRKYAEMVFYYAPKNCCYGRIADDKIALLIKKSDFSEKPFIEGIDQMKSLFNNFKLHVNIGVYEIQNNTDRVELMYDKALLAMQKYSEVYQNVFVFYDDDRFEQMYRDKDVIDNIEAALANNEIEMYLQPKVDRAGIAIGCEAKAVWHNPREGFMSASKFIDALKHSGLICKLDTYIWRQAAKTLLDWKVEGVENFGITVNVDAKDLYYVDIAENFRNLTKEFKVSASNFIIQMSENDFMNNYQKATEVLNELKKDGFEVAITNFGDGYSSLNMLKDMDVNYFKMDIKFMHEADRERNTKILEAIILMSKELGYELSIKGVENLIQLEELSCMGFEVFQGPYFCSPVDVESFERKYLPQLF